MVLICTESSKSSHTGSVFGSPVEGSVESTGQNFVFIENELILTSNGIIHTPLHDYTGVPTFHEHFQSMTNVQKHWVTIEGITINVVGDNSGDSDLTTLTTTGQNFVRIN